MIAGHDDQIILNGGTCSGLVIQGNTIGPVGPAGGSNDVTLAKPDAIVMHPGPINRGRELSSEVADFQRSVILNQVENGIAVRMAVLERVIG